MKIKVLHILHAVGGVDVSLRLILSNIDSSKFENVVIQGKTDNDSKYLNNVNNPVKSYKINIIRNINLFKDVSAIIKSYKIVKKENPNLIHAHSAKGGVIGKLVGSLTGIPVLHTPQAYSYLSTEKPSKKFIYLRIEKILSRLNNKILASSNSEKNRAIKEVGYKEKRVIVFNNAINQIDNIPDLSIPRVWPENYICSVGRPSYQKNIELMIDVLISIKKEMPNIHLVLMGVGYHSPNLSVINSKIKNNKLKENITLLEWTSRTDVFNIINNSKLYLSTARYEGLPYSVIESLALQKACVVSDADGNRDLVQNGYNGFVIFNNDVEQYKTQIINLLKNEDLRQELELNSKKLFNEKFNIVNTITHLEEIYIKQSKQ
ncbi:MAG: glycosyltransferase [Flavobacteriaceae bacterium]